MLFQQPRITVNKSASSQVLFIEFNGEFERPIYSFSYANFRPAVSIAHQLVCAFVVIVVYDLVPKSLQGSFICDEENTACNQYLTTVLYEFQRHVLL